MNFALSSKAHLKDPKSAIQQIREKLPSCFPQQLDREHNPGSLWLAIPLFILMATLLLFSDIQPDPQNMAINRAGFFEKTNKENIQSQVLEKMTADPAKLADNKASAREAMLWMSILTSYDDSSLSIEGLMQKFKNMGIASTILSTTANGRLRRKFWSEKAVQFSRHSLGMLEGMMPHPDLGELEEVKTRLLIALALNYYEGGQVQKDEMVELFEKISPPFLIRTGFCNNLVLKSLHGDKIIKLPNYLSEKYL